MKIIGTTDKGFIVEATGNELCNVAGAYWTGDPSAPKLGVGVEVDVSAAYNKLYALQDSDAIRQSVERLRALASDLEREDVIIGPVTRDLKEGGAAWTPFIRSSF